MIQDSATFPEVLANRHALVVEDDKDALDLLATILKIAGAKVAAAGHGIFTLGNLPAITKSRTVH